MLMLSFQKELNNSYGISSFFKELNSLTYMIFRVYLWFTNSVFLMTCSISFLFIFFFLIWEDAKVNFFPFIWIYFLNFIEKYWYFINIEWVISLLPFLVIMKYCSYILSNKNLNLLTVETNSVFYFLQVLTIRS